jgi:hypothetical protein
VENLLLEEGHHVMKAQPEVVVQDEAENKK